MSKASLDAARECRELLFMDLNGRRGFDTGNIDSETLSEWKIVWRNAIARALDQREREVVERCAGIAERYQHDGAWTDAGRVASITIATAIRAGTP